jgi:hypothetical protein
MALVGGIERRGWMTAKVREECARLTAEPLPFHLPKDVAGR